MKDKIISGIFFVCCFADMLANTLSLSAVHLIAKPLLMPGLFLLAVTQIGFTGDRKGVLILSGLLFGWLGDVLLMFENRAPVFFILGLVSFLCGHVLYIFYFKKTGAALAPAKTGNLFFIIPVIIYSAALLYVLFPTLGELKIPVTIYACVLSAMLCTALWTRGKINKNAAERFIAGAVLFVISDSVLAINKFYYPFFAAGFIIMATYCMAQYFIVTGAIKLYKLQQASIGE
jgi:uncharacterized membrane protein YhhN